VKGTTVTVEVANMLDEQVIVTAEVVSSRVFDDGSIEGPFVVLVRVRRADMVGDDDVPLADNVRRLRPEVV
jgi:hypothetical protein